MRVSQVFREAGFVELGKHLAEVARGGTPEVMRRRMHSQEPSIVDSNEEDEAEISSHRA